MSNNNEPSAISKICNAAMSRVHKPTPIAEIIATARAPAGAENTYAQGVQMAWDGGKAFSEEYMKAAHRQHAPESTPIEGVDYYKNESGEINAFEPLADKGENYTYDETTGETHYHATEQNEGLESYKVAVEVKESITNATDASKSNNEGIASFREGSSGQTAKSASSTVQSSEQGTSQSDSGGNQVDKGLQCK
jgi:hypothetical protein